jgi:hypothetical protein
VAPSKNTQIVVVVAGEKILLRFVRFVRSDIEYCFCTNERTQQQNKGKGDT